MKYFLILLMLLPSLCVADVFSDKLGQLESSNNYKAVNRFGYLGKYQFGNLALIDLGYKNKKGWTGKDQIRNAKDFLNSPKIQEKAFKEWRVILKKYLKYNGSMKYVGKKFSGIKVTKYGLMAASHLVGAYAVKKMLKTGKIPKDANKVKATDYMKHFEGFSNE